MKATCNKKISKNVTVCILIGVAVIIIGVALLLFLPNGTEKTADTSGDTQLAAKSTNCVRGTCGDYIKWTFDYDTGELTVTGVGRIEMFTDWITDSGEEFNLKTIKSLVLSDGVIGIDGVSFDWIENLRSVSIAASVVDIPTHSFSYCNNLETITVAPENTAYKSIDGVLFDITGTTLMLYPASSKRKSYVIPPDVTCIASQAFHGSKNLTSIGFMKCSGLVNIGDSSFKNCNAITSITLPSCVANIGDSAFSSCPKLETVRFDDNSRLIAIENYSFSGCKSLNTVDFGKNDSLERISSMAFSGCKSLTEFTVPRGVTTILSDAFLGCDSLLRINIEQGNTAYRSIDGILFSEDATALIAYPGGREDTSYEIPSEVVEIKDQAFEGHMHLNVITFEKNCKLNTIGFNAFEECENLTRVDFENCNELKIIDSGAFEACNNLTKINLPDSVETISEWAFSRCEKLSEITIPVGVTTLGSDTFNMSTALTAINVAPGNKTFLSIDGVLFRREGMELMRYPIGKTGETYEIPHAVTEIWHDAFMDCTELKSVTITNNVTHMSESVFNGCTGLEKVTFEKDSKLDFIDSGVFSNCTSLTSITLPDSVVHLSSDPFNNCTSLKTFVIPDGVTSMNQPILSGCTGLERLHIPSTVTLSPDEKIVKTCVICSDSENSYAKTFAEENGNRFEVCNGH